MSLAFHTSDGSSGTLGGQAPRTRSRGAVEIAVLGGLWLAFVLGFSRVTMPLGLHFRVLFYPSYYFALGLVLAYGLWPRFARRGHVLHFVGAGSLAFLLFAIVEQYLIDPVLFHKADTGFHRLTNVLDFLWYASAISLPVLLARLAFDTGRAERFGGQPSGTRVPTLAVPTSALLDVKQGRAAARIAVDSIVWLKADRDYTVIVTTEASHYVLGGLSGWLERLPPSFRRVHRSYIVNLDRAERRGDRALDTPAGEAPIGRTYRAGLRALWRERGGPSVE
jgi:DNA-binding LytR/AlgR family response regulator